MNGLFFFLESGYFKIREVFDEIREGVLKNSLLF